MDSAQPTTPTREPFWSKSASKIKSSIRSKLSPYRSSAGDENTSPLRHKRSFYDTITSSVKRRRGGVKRRKSFNDIVNGVGQENAGDVLIGCSPSSVKLSPAPSSPSKAKSPNGPSPRNPLNDLVLTLIKAALLPQHHTQKGLTGSRMSHNPAPPYSSKVTCGCTLRPNTPDDYLVELIRAIERPYTPDSYLEGLILSTESTSPEETPETRTSKLVLNVRADEKSQGDLSSAERMGLTASPQSPPQPPQNTPVASIFGVSKTFDYCEPKSGRALGARIDQDTECTTSKLGVPAWEKTFENFEPGFRGSTREKEDYYNDLLCCKLGAPTWELINLGADILGKPKPFKPLPDIPSSKVDLRDRYLEQSIELRTPSVYSPSLRVIKPLLGYRTSEDSSNEGNSHDVSSQHLDPSGLYSPTRQLCRETRKLKPVSNKSQHTSNPDQLSYVPRSPVHSLVAKSSKDPKFQADHSQESSEAELSDDEFNLKWENDSVKSTGSLQLPVNFVGVNFTEGADSEDDGWTQRSTESGPKSLVDGNMTGFATSVMPSASENLRLKTPGPKKKAGSIDESNTEKFFGKDLHQIFSYITQPLKPLSREIQIHSPRMNPFDESSKIQSHDGGLSVDRLASPPSVSEESLKGSSDAESQTSNDDQQFRPWLAEQCDKVQIVQDYVQSLEKYQPASLVHRLRKPATDSLAIIEECMKDIAADDARFNLEECFRALDDYEANFQQMAKISVGVNAVTEQRKSSALSAVSYRHGFDFSTYGDLIEDQPDSMISSDMRKISNTPTLVPSFSSSDTLSNDAEDFYETMIHSLSRSKHYSRAAVQNPTALKSLDPNSNTDRPLKTTHWDQSTLRRNSAIGSPDMTPSLPLASTRDANGISKTKNANQSFFKRDSAIAVPDVMSLGVSHSKTDANELSKALHLGRPAVSPNSIVATPALKPVDNSITFEDSDQLFGIGNMRPTQMTSQRYQENHPIGCHKRVLSEAHDFFSDPFHDDDDDKLESTHPFRNIGIPTLSDALNLSHSTTSGVQAVNGLPGTTCESTDMSRDRSLPIESQSSTRLNNLFADLNISPVDKIARLPRPGVRSLVHVFEPRGLVPELPILSGGPMNRIKTPDRMQTALEKIPDDCNNSGDLSECDDSSRMSNYDTDESVGFGTPLKRYPGALFENVKNNGRVMTFTGIPRTRLDGGMDYHPKLTMDDEI